MLRTAALLVVALAIPGLGACESEPSGEDQCEAFVAATVDRLVECGLCSSREACRDNPLFGSFFDCTDANQVQDFDVCLDTIRSTPCEEAWDRFVMEGVPACETKETDGD